LVIKHLQWKAVTKRGHSWEDSIELDLKKIGDRSMNFT